KVKRFRKYLALIGKRDSIAVETLAQAMPVSVKTAVNDLQDMLDGGILPVGYVDVQRSRLVLTAEGMEDAPEPEKPKTDRAKDENEYLIEIKTVNDAVTDESMSRKIDRIGEITGKILDYQRKNPNRSGELRSFLNYYLPTTLKILRAYAQLEAQGIEGENITAAKARIEGMMDRVVEGFEKQLDKLFQNAALDITSDVEVLEKMLNNDGLSGGGTTLSL
ncbi:MAG: 5-bromo-4-chloroindolyl phosphate hydrolysis family protein, partial [Oscillospiraceae bacterium]